GAWKKSGPASGRRTPPIKLKTVLLPDPFGPMRPTAVPGSTSNEQLSTARMPPNRRVSPATRSSAIGAVLLTLPRVGRQWHEPATGASSDVGRIDRHLLARLHLDHHRVDRHAVPVGEGREPA